MLQTFKTIYLKNLETLAKELNSYNSETDLWIIAPGISNSPGNLTLHLIGNLNYFVGSILGETGYIRDRDKEFSEKDTPRQQLLENVAETAQMLDITISGMRDEDLLKIFPINTFGEGRTNGYVLTFLLAHFNYHLGQINYHRRLLNK